MLGERSTDTQSAIRFLIDAKKMCDAAIRDAWNPSNLSSTQHLYSDMQYICRMLAEKSQDDNQMAAIKLLEEAKFHCNIALEDIHDDASMQRLQDDLQYINQMLLDTEASTL